VVSASTGLTNIFAGSPTRTQGNVNGPTLSSQFGSPVTLNFNRDFTQLYVADHSYHHVRRITLSTATVALYAGTAAAGTGAENVAPTTSALYYPFNALTDLSGNVYISDYGNCRIRKISGSVITTWYGSSCNGGQLYDGYNAENSKTLATLYLTRDFIDRAPWSDDCTWFIKM